MVRVVLMACHLVFVAIAAWLPVFCILMDLSQAYDETVRRVQRKLAMIATGNLVLGAITGLLLGWAIWEPAFSAALGAIGSRLPFAIVEFCFSFLIYVLYVVSLLHGRWLGRRGRIIRAAFLFVSLTNLWYHFPILLGVIHQLQELGVAERMTSAQFRQVAFSPKILLGAVHFLLASAIVGSLSAQWILRREPISDGFLRRVAMSSVVASVLQWPVGLAAYWRMPRQVQVELLATSEGNIAIASVLAAVWLLLMAQISLIIFPRSKNGLAAVAIMVAVVMLQMCWLSRLA